MKKTFSMFLASIMALSMTVPAMADVGGVVSLTPVNGETVYFDAIQDAIDEAISGATIKLHGNISLGQNDKVVIDKDLIFDLGNHTVSGADKPFEIVGAKVTLKNGTITTTTNGYGLRVLDGSDVVTENLVIDGNAAFGVFVRGLGDSSSDVTTFDAKDGTAIEVKGTAISGNGLASYGNTQINIKSGATIISEEGAGIYHPQSGELNISGGSIRGVVGVYVKDGNIMINGGSITGTGEDAEYSPSNNGFNPTGDALVIDNDDSYNKDSLKVNVSGGTFISTENNTAPVASYADVSEDKMQAFVSGGSFSNQVEDSLLSDSVKAELNQPQTTAPYSYFASISAAQAKAKAGDTVTDLSAGANAQPINMYTVTIDYNSSQSNDVKVVADGYEITQPAAPVRSGYQFSGWIINGSFATFPYKVNGANVTLEASWTLNESSSSSSGSSSSNETKYDIEVEDDIENGAIEVNYTSAEEDTKVTIEVDPDRGYKLYKLTVVDDDDNKIKVTKKSSTKYTFKMPDEDVYIDAVFKDEDDFGEYTIEIEDNIKYGSVDVSADEAEEGDTITVTVTSDKGYQENDVVVLDEYGDKVKLTKKGSTEYRYDSKTGQKNATITKYTFKMPDENVTVDATFKKFKASDHATDNKYDNQNAIILTIGQRVAWIYGEMVINDVAPVIKNSRTMLPIRIVANSLGANVAWDAIAHKVTITKPGKTIEIYIGSSTAYVNGKPVQLDSPAFIENSRTYLPVKFVTSQLGADVHWDNQTNQVFIYPGV